MGRMIRWVPEMNLTNVSDSQLLSQGAGTTCAHVNLALEEKNMLQHNV